ncbi:monooxygenase family protein [Haloprofundus halophilus]|uniref:monooxygenase family protein n=1 Tax=Haloprofundus halophilus TaxID=2283527 RepID=UPI0018E555AA|nr:DUF4188 domain-containing protein [Haloprofundus halophilus]
MAEIFRERMAAEMDDGVVIYINGIRLNKLSALPHWLLANWKVARMFKELEADPKSGFLGYTPIFLGLRKGAAMQYWRSLEDLQRFATEQNGPHVSAWKWYNEKVDPDGGLGFWAELYVVDGDSFETFFRNVPPIGIGKYAKMVPMREHKRRLGLSPDGSARKATSAEEPIES